MRRPRLTDVSLVSVLAILAHAEYRFGVDVLGLPETTVAGVTVSLALAVPAAIDTYVIAALRRGADIGWSLALVVLSVTGGTLSHLVAFPTWAKVIAAGVFAAVLAVVLIRVHELEREPAHVAESAEPQPVEVPPAAEPQPAPEPASAPAADPEPAPRPRPARPAPAGRKPAAHDPQHRDAVLAILRELGATAGRPTAARALREAGYGVSTDHLPDLLAEARRPHLAAAGGDR